MKLNIIYGRAGTGKSSYCFQEIKKQMEQEKSIYLITPEQFSYTAERKLMETIQKKAILNVEVLTLSRMAYRVLQEVGGDNQTELTDSGIAMLLSHLLEKEKKHLTFLGKSEENIKLIANAITEFKKHGVTQEKLIEQAEKEEDKRFQKKLQDLGHMYTMFQNQIAGKYIDETDRLSMLAEKMHKTDLFENSSIFIDEFSGFTTQEYQVIEQLLMVAKQVTITISTDEKEVTGTPETNLFYINQKTIQKLKEIAEKLNCKVEYTFLEEPKRFQNEELKAIEKNIYQTQQLKYLNNSENIHLFLAQNPYTEIEEIAKQITKLVRTKKYRYQDMAIITKQLEVYSSLIQAIFYQYEIPVFIDEKKEISQNPVIQYLLSIIEVFQKNWSYESVFQYLKTGFTDIEEQDIFLLENYCIKWRIQYQKWKKEFTYGKSDKQEQKKVEYLEEIRKKTVEPFLELQEKIGKEKTVFHICKQLYGFFKEQKIEEKLEQKIRELEEKGEIERAKEYEASLPLIFQLFDEMVLVFQEDKMTFDRFLNTLKIGLKYTGLGKIPGTIDQVIVGDVERSRSHRVKAVFILGLNDGVFPSGKQVEGFLNDQEREKLKEKGIELAKTTLEQLYEEQFNIYKAFTTAEETLFLSYVSSDLEGKTLRPSMLVGKMKKLFPKLEEKSDMVDIKSEILTQKTTYETLLGELKKVSMGEAIDLIWFLVYQYYSENKQWKEKLQKDLKGLQYTNLPEVIKKENIEKLYGNTIQTSITKLEKYRSCPFSYYLQFGLRLKEKQEFKVKSLDTGIFMHEVIEEFFEQIQETNQTLGELTEENLSKMVNQIVEEKLKEVKNDIFRATEKYKVLVIRLKRIMLKALKYMIESILVSDFEIFGTEVEFHKQGGNSPICVTLEDGKTIEITGKIDRIDLAKTEKGKYIRIIDYKSSSKDIDLNEVYAGIQIQLLTYSDVMCDQEEAMPAAVLYFGLMEQMISADRKMSEEELEEKIKSNFKMKGLIVADINVIKMQDKTLQKGASKIIPAYIDAQGKVSEKRSNGVTQEQFLELQKYMKKTIRQIAKEILSGRIDLLPYEKKKRTPCKYCSYQTICGFQAGSCQNGYRYIDSKTKEEILKKIQEENNRS